MIEKKSGMASQLAKSIANPITTAAAQLLFFIPSQ